MAKGHHTTMMHRDERASKEGAFRGLEVHSGTSEAGAFAE